MSACLSSGGAAYSFELEKVKSPPLSSTTTRATTSSHNTPSPSSTLSESNSPLAISTRKPRTQRKRPNQTYNEAVALLSTAYPNIFSSSTSTSTSPSSAAAKKIQSNSQFYGMVKSPLSDSDDASELLLPLESIEEPDFLFNPTIQTKSDLFFEQKEVNSGVNNSGGEIDESKENRFELCDEFDAESILDEEIEEGIDSIMGNVEVKTGENLEIDESRVSGINRSHRIGRLEQMMMMNSWSRNSKGFGYGFGFAGNFHLGLGLRSALRENNEANLWRFPTVNVDQISPRIQTATIVTTSTDEEKSVAENKPIVSTLEKSNKKKKKKKVAAVTPLSVTAAESKSSESCKEDSDSSPKMEKRSGLLLKLDYDRVLDAWSDKASPFSDEILGSEAAGANVHARLGEIDLFGENGMREASVLRYKEKRRTRLFSKKIRYQVRKLNADQRPRMKGRFVRRPNASNPSGQRL